MIYTCAGCGQDIQVSDPGRDSPARIEDYFTALISISQASSLA